MGLTTGVENWCTVPLSHPISLFSLVPSTDDECCDLSTVEVEELVTHECSIEPLDANTEHFKTLSPETRYYPSPFEDMIGLLATHTANWSMLQSSPLTSTVPSSGKELSDLSPLHMETLDT